MGLCVHHISRGTSLTFFVFPFYIDFSYYLSILLVGSRRVGMNYLGSKLIKSCLFSCFTSQGYVKLIVQDDKLLLIGINADTWLIGLE